MDSFLIAISIILEIIKDFRKESGKMDYVSVINLKFLHTLPVNPFVA